MSTPIAVCSQCGASAETGRIFCTKCGAALSPPNSLVSSNSEGADAAVPMSFLKRAIILVIKGIGMIAALGFLVSPVTRYPGILWFGASIVVGFLCIAALSYLDDDFMKKHRNEGYWPKPLDWSRSPNNSSNEKPTE